METISKMLVKDKYVILNIYFYTRIHILYAGNKLIITIVGSEVVEVANFSICPRFIANQTRTSSRT